VTSTELTPLTRPYLVAPDTYVVPWPLPAPPVGYFCVNSLLIRGAEPVIVDTGAPANREQWFANVFSLVEPEDVRWIFLSHDDRDHSGNLLPLLEACPNATLLTTWFSVGRMAEEWMTPLPRCRFLNEGETIDVGDRTPSALRPPLFDSPTTRGLFDQRTGVFWSVDAFASPVPAPVEWADELAESEYVQGQYLGARILAP
jgi:flavorubredoxin